LKSKITFKVLLLTISLIVSLFTLEILMRIVGDLYQESRVTKSKEVKVFKSKRYERSGELQDIPLKILTLGDSFTFGGLVKENETYPRQLEDLIKKKTKIQNIDVINGGMCERTSRDILNSLPIAINLHNPDYIILLVGAANRFTPEPYIKDVEGHWDSIRRGFYSLRVYKMFRFIRDRARILLSGVFNKTKLKNREEKIFHVATEEITRIIHGKSLSKNENILKAHKLIADKMFEQALVFLEEELKFKKTNLDAILMKGYVLYQTNKWELAEKMFLRAKEMEPGIRTESFLYNFYYWVAYKLKSGHPSESIPYFIKALEISQTLWTSSHKANYLKTIIDPEIRDKLDREIYKNYRIFSDWDVFYIEMLRAFQKQSKISSEYMLGEFERIERKNPKLIYDKYFMLYKKIFSDHREWENKIVEWLANDLENIVKISHQNGIPLLLQTYPVKYSDINLIIRKISKNLNVPLVDNEEKFKGLLGKRPSQVYLQDDDHTTPLGNKLMAENILPHLISIMSESSAQSKHE
jgi:lysophospholipase L1-like esterase